MEPSIEAVHDLEIVQDAHVESRHTRKDAAISVEHLMSHRLKNPWCEACVRAKMHNRPARRVHFEDDEKPISFGEIITADHFITARISEEAMLRERHGLVILDRGTDYVACYPVPDYIACYPVPSKTADDTERALAHFAGDSTVSLFHSDNSPELLKAVRDLGWRHSTSTPGVPQSNGVAERAVRKVLEGIRTLLDQAGLPAAFWSYAAKHFCHSSNIEVIDGESAWNRRHGKGHFKGPRIPFGSREVRN